MTAFRDSGLDVAGVDMSPAAPELAPDHEVKIADLEREVLPYPLQSFDYVFSMVQLLRELRVARIYLPDTLGIFCPEDVRRYMGLMAATWPE